MNSLPVLRSARILRGLLLLGCAIGSFGSTGCFEDDAPAWPADFAITENDCSSVDDWDEVYRVHLVDNSEAGFALNSFGFEPTDPLAVAREGQGKIDDNMVFHLEVGFGRVDDYETVYCEGSVDGALIAMSCDDGTDPETGDPVFCTVELDEL